MRASAIRNRSARSTSAPWSDLCVSHGLRGVCLTLAALAIALKVLIPAGFMTAAPINDLPFALVLCTGQGAMVIAPGDALPGEKDPGMADNETHNTPCVFAGQALGAPAPNLLDATRVEFVTYTRTSPPVSPVALAPGRGLAAPPLPARGPPSLLI